MLQRLNSASGPVALVALFVALGGTAFAVRAHSVGTKQLKRDAVTSGKIENKAVKASELNRGAVRNGKIATEAVTTDKIAAGAVTSGLLADNAVTRAQLAADAVTGGKIASGAVTAGKIVAGAVMAGKIADGAVTGAKIVPDAIDSSKIANGQVRAAELGDIAQVENTVDVADGAVGTASVECPADTVVISGGGFPGSFTSMDLVTTIRLGNGWRVQAENDTGAGTQTLTVRAYCLEA